MPRKTYGEGKAVARTVEADVVLSEGIAPP